jgi:nitrite reductase/ring-hydroxylating ferredoxin subunit
MRVYVGSKWEMRWGKRRTVVHERKCIAIFNVRGKLYALDNECPHAGGPLDQGFIEKKSIVCPWHGWAFPLPIEGAPLDGVERYPVVVEDGKVYVEVPDAPAEGPS